MFGVFIFIVFCVGSLVYTKPFSRVSLSRCFGMFALKCFYWTLDFSCIQFTVAKLNRQK